MDNFKNIQKVLFVKNYVSVEHDGLCYDCGKEICGDFILKHVGNRECKTKDTISVLMPTNKNPKRRRNLPDCERCFNETPSEFYECVEKLVPMHKRCIYRYFNKET